MSIKINIKFILNIFILIIPILTIKSPEVIYLNEDNFESNVYSSNEMWLIEIYSEKCESCASFESIWKQLINKVDYLSLGRINIDEPKGMKVATKLNALENGIPALKLIISKEDIVDIMTGIEEPFPNSRDLKRRIEKALKEKRKFEDL